MKCIITSVFMFLPLLASSNYIKVGILSHDLDPDTIKKIWSMAQNYPLRMRLEPVVEMAQWRDIDNAAKFSRAICSLVNQGVHALVYLGSPRWNSFISSYATHMGLPFIAAGVNEEELGQNQICMLPDTTEAASDTILRFGWDNFIFLYDSDNGPDQLQKVLSSLLSVEFAPRVDGFWKVDSVNQTMYYLKNLPSLTRRHFLLATSEEFATALANSVEKCDILLLTPVGTEENIPHRRENTITKFSVIDAEDPVLDALENRVMTLSSYMGRGRSGKEIPDSAILHHDSSRILDYFFNNIAIEKPSALKSRQNQDCLLSTDIHEIDGFLKEVSIEHGATGRITFDAKGKRYDYKLSVMYSLPYSDIEKVLTWSDGYGFRPLGVLRGASSSATYAAYQSAPPIKVASILTPPFLQKNENGTFSGYVVDFLDELSKEIKREYDLQLVKDGNYGSLRRHGEWSGMVGELIRGEADIAVAPLTKSLERQEVIDFSKNILSTGLNILLKKTEFEMESSTFAPFAFLSVWSVETWIVLIFVVAIYSAGNYGIGRFIGSPDRVRALESKGTDNLSPCGSIWFTVGALLCRDTGIYPRYITHRLWALLWWIFCIFIGLLYVSMVTTELIKARTSVTTTHSRKTSQEVLKEYIDTGLPVVGSVMAGSTEKLFVNSEIGLYQQYGRILSENRHTRVTHQRAGVERVRKSDGKYAFLTESAYNDFVANNKPCDTLVTANYLVTRPYAVALPKNSSLKEIIDHGILSLMETGKLRELYEKWWHNQPLTCEDSELNILPKVYNTAMTLHEVSGIFYLFILFSLLSIAAAAIEFYIRTRKIIVR